MGYCPHATTLPILPLVLLAILAAISVTLSLKSGKVDKLDLTLKGETMAVLIAGTAASIGVAGGMRATRTNPRPKAPIKIWE